MLMVVFSSHYPAGQWHYISVNSSKWPSRALPSPWATGVFEKGVILEFVTGGRSRSAGTRQQIVPFSPGPIPKLQAPDLDFTLISERLQFILIDFYNQLSHTSSSPGTTTCDLPGVSNNWIGSYRTLSSGGVCRRYYGRYVGGDY